MKNKKIQHKMRLNLNQKRMEELIEEEEESTSKKNESKPKKRWRGRIN